MKKIIFMGTPDFAVPILEKLIEMKYDIVLVITQPDRPKGRKRTLTPPPVKTAALHHNIPVYQPEKLTVNYETVFSYEADMIVTAAYGQLLPKALLEHPPYGCINVHASLLPELRGGAPIHYAILQGKKETGITIMYMTEKLDAGDIIAKRSIPIEAEDHVGILHDQLATVGAALLEETLPNIFSNRHKRHVQEEAKATYAPNITREQEKIDWHQPNEVIYNHIRGLHPWPVAYTIYKGERMKIWWGEIDNQLYEHVEPGEIVHIDEQSITVVCGNKRGIRLTSIQLAGKKKLSVHLFLRGNPDTFKIGQVLE